LHHLLHATYLGAKEATTKAYDEEEEEESFAVWFVVVVS
jgi:hypothetical protein